MAATLCPLQFRSSLRDNRFQRGAHLYFQPGGGGDLTKFHPADVLTGKAGTGRQLGEGDMVTVPKRPQVGFTSHTLLLYVVDGWQLTPALPAPARQFRLDHTILGTHGLDHITVPNVNAGMAGFPDRQALDLRHGIHSTFHNGGLIHLIGPVVRHSVGPVANGPAGGIQPTVALDEADAVRRPAAQPV